MRRLLLTWFLAATLPFLLIRAFDRYLVGSLVPLAIFLACLLPQLRSRLAFRLGMLAALLPGLALGGFAAWFGLGGWPWLVAPALYLSWAWWRDRGLGHLLAAPILYWTALLALLFPALGINALPAEVVALGRQQPVVFFEGPQPAMLAILSGQPHRQYRDLEAHAAALRGPAPRFLPRATISPCSRKNSPAPATAPSPWVAIGPWPATARACASPATAPAPPNGRRPSPAAAWNRCRRRSSGSGSKPAEATAVKKALFHGRP